MTESSFWAGSVRGGAPSAAQAASIAAQQAAENLFHKTVEALEQGDEEKAERLARQTALRPFDDHEEVWPGPWQAHYALFELMTDVVEEWPAGDHGWIDALSDVISRSSGRQLEELRHLAAVLSQDARFHSVDELEARRLRGLAAGADPLANPSDEVPEDERVDYVLDLASLVATLRRRLWEETE